MDLINSLLDFVAMMIIFIAYGVLGLLFTAAIAAVTGVVLKLKELKDDHDAHERVRQDFAMRVMARKEAEANRRRLYPY